MPSSHINQNTIKLTSRPPPPGGDGRLLRHDETAATSGVAVPRVGVVVVRVAGGRVAAVLAPALLGEVDAVVHRVPAPVVLALPAVHVVRADDQVARGAVLVDAGVPDGDPTQGGGLRRGTDPEGQSHGRERARDEPIITYKEQEIDPASVRSIWYRNGVTRWLWPDLKVRPGLLEYTLSSLQHQADTMVMFLDNGAFWVSNPQAIKRAQNKPPQLKVANMLGLRTPETIFASDAERAAAFVKRHGTVILKPMAHCAPGGLDQYSTLRAGDQIDFRGLVANPHIFQELIKPKVEVRVSIIGSQVFAAKVGDRDEAATLATGKRDYREAFNTGLFDVEPYDLPQDITDRLVAFVRHYGTVCGYADLIQSLDDGEWYFLENNPNGQWVFQDDETTEGIGRALAQLLMTGQV